MTQHHTDEFRKELKSYFGHVLEFYNNSPEDLFVPSDATMAHRRALMLWSILIIVTVGLGLLPEKAPWLDVPLNQSTRDYFTFGAAAILFYQAVMYRVRWYKDLRMRALRRDIVNLALGPKIRATARRLDELRKNYDIPAEWSDYPDLVRTLEAETSSPLTDRLLIEAIRVPPAFLFVVAFAFLARTYTSFLVTFVIAVGLWIPLVWLDRYMLKKAPRERQKEAS